ncbi:helix-turn-helix domain-containing protein [Streptomyces sp. INA 01156]
MKALHPKPSALPVRVGARLRACRKAQGLTIEQVAAATGLTRGFISRVERDETSPSVATLVTLCQVLSLPVGSLFEDADTEVIRLGDAPRSTWVAAGSSTAWSPRAASRRSRCCARASTPARTAETTSTRSTATWRSSTSSRERSPCSSRAAPRL